MYEQMISARILLAIGIALLIISLVLGWISFAVPDWLQYNERASNIAGSPINPVKFGLWYRCVFNNRSNDFVCTTWNTHVPSFVRVVQVFVPFGLAWGCLGLLAALIGFASRRAFVTSVLLSGLFTFLNFIFITIGVTVFATDSLVFVERLRVDNNEYPRRWAMWLMIPNLILAFLAAVCFLLGSILNWCDYQRFRATGFFNHSVDKYGDSVFKAPSDSQLLSAVRKQYPEYPNPFYQLNNQQQQQQQPANSMYYPNVQPSTAAYPGMYPYSRAASPTMNQLYPHPNIDGHYHRHFITENSDYDDYPRMTRSRRRSHSRVRRSRSHSRSPSPKPTQFVPIPVPYYQPQPAAAPTATVPTNQNTGLGFLQSQLKKAFVDGNSNNAVRTTTAVNQGSNPTPVYTLAYRPNILTGAPAATYVTAQRPIKIDIHSLSSENEEENRHSKKSKVKKININEAWAWRKL